MVQRWKTVNLWAVHTLLRRGLLCKSASATRLSQMLLACLLIETLMWYVMTPVFWKRVPERSLSAVWNQLGRFSQLLAKNRSHSCFRPSRARTSANSNTFCPCLAFHARKARSGLKTLSILFLFPREHPGRLPKKRRLFRGWAEFSSVVCHWLVPGATSIPCAPIRLNTLFVSLLSNS